MIKQVSGRTNPIPPDGKNLHGTGVKTAITLLCACVVLSLTGCKDDHKENTSHPDKAQITLKTDEVVGMEGITIPDEYMIQVGDYTETASGVTHLFSELLEPGNYHVRVYNEPEHIVVSGKMAAVAEAARSTNSESKFVNAEPGWLFTGVTDVTLEKDIDYEFSVVMHQQVRELTFIIEPVGGTTGQIERVEGTLSGVAGTLDFDTDTHGTPSNVKLQFTKITSGTDAGMWSATVRLLGVAGEQQKLNAVISFTGNTPAPVSLESDLSTELSDFNKEKDTSLKLDGMLVMTPTAAGLAATINGWGHTSGGSVAAH